MHTDKKEILDELRKVIERAFDYKAERYLPSELADYFTRRELLPTLTYHRMHHALTGRKGTGKTAILKYLSLPVQAHCADKAGPAFVGFYLTFGENLTPQVSFDPDSQKEVARLFGHWFNLYACKAIIDSIAGGKTEGLQGIDPGDERQFITELWTSFFMISSPPPSSLLKASSDLNDFQRELRRLLSDPLIDKATLAEKYLGRDTCKYTGRVTDIADFPRIIETVQETIRPFKNIVFLILIDEYDNLSDVQQVVVNTALAGGSSLYYMKLGVLSEQGLKTRSTLTGLKLRGDQLEFVDIEHFGSDREYEDFVRACIQARFSRIRRDVLEGHKFGDLFVSLDTLIPAKSLSDQLREQGISTSHRQHHTQLSLLHREDENMPALPPVSDSTAGIQMDEWWTLLKHDKRPVYCGIATICLLSSGLIRSAIEIVYAILKQALTNHWEALQQADCIPYDIQDSIIRLEAEHWLTTKLRADIRGRTWDGEGQLADVAGNLIRSLSNQFYDAFLSLSREPTLNCFSLKEVGDAEADGIKAIQEGELTGIFTGVSAPSVSLEDAAVFSLHRIYSVRNNLPPTRSGCLRLSWTKFEECCRSPQGARSRRPDIEISYFFGIGFREPWENRVRQDLPGVSPPKFRYSDGAGAHKGSILVVGTVENRIDAARLCIFDVTTENENVCFEYGLALAKGKPIRHFLNDQKTPKHPNELIRFLRGAVVERYSFLEEPSEQHLETLKQAMVRCGEWYIKLPRRRRTFCSIRAKCNSSPSPLVNQVVIAAPSGTLADRCRPELERLIREDVHLQIYQIGQNDQPYICNLCLAIGRSHYCIVDTTGCDPTYCGILGLAFGFGGRKILNIYEANNPGLITNYAGHTPMEYADKQGLLHVIKSFLQS
jgi:hypothetical protein